MCFFMKKVYSIFLILIIPIVLFSGCLQSAESGNVNDAKDVSSEIVQKGDVVKVEYKGWLDSGDEFDSSIGKAPLEFTVGAGKTIKGFEKAVLGHRVGEEFTVKIMPADAYGTVNPQYIIEIPKSQFKNAEDLQVGQVVESNSGPPGVVKEIKEDSIVVDFNHPLAGQTLNFWIKIVDLKKK